MKLLFVISGVVVGHGASAFERTRVQDNQGAAVYEVADDSPVSEGYTVTTGNGLPVFTAPAPVAPKVGPIAFQMLFTPQEMITADTLKATDKVLASFWKLIDDPRTDTVDLSLKSVQGAIEYTLTAINSAGTAVDVPVRLSAILSGVPQ